MAYKFKSAFSKQVIQENYTFVRDHAMTDPDLKSLTASQDIKKIDAARMQQFVASLSESLASRTYSDAKTYCYDMEKLNRINATLAEHRQREFYNADDYLNENTQHIKKKQPRDLPEEVIEAYIYLHNAKRTDPDLIQIRAEANLTEVSYDQLNRLHHSIARKSHNRHAADARYAGSKQRTTDENTFYTLECIIAFQFADAPRLRAAQQKIEREERQKSFDAAAAELEKKETRRKLNQKLKSMTPNNNKAVGFATFCGVVAVLAYGFIPQLFKVNHEADKQDRKNEVRLAKQSAAIYHAASNEGQVEIAMTKVIDKFLHSVDATKIELCVQKEAKSPYRLYNATTLHNLKVSEETLPTCHQTTMTAVETDRYQTHSWYSEQTVGFVFKKVADELEIAKLTNSEGQKDALYFSLITTAVAPKTTFKNETRFTPEPLGTTDINEALHASNNFKSSKIEIIAKTSGSPTDKNRKVEFFSRDGTPYKPNTLTGLTLTPSP